MSIWQLSIILAIVLVLFGAKRLRNLGSDLGASVKGFRDAIKEGESGTSEEKRLEDTQGWVMGAEVIKEKDKT